MRITAIFIVKIFIITFLEAYGNNTISTNWHAGHIWTDLIVQYKTFFTNTSFIFVLINEVKLWRTGKANIHTIGGNDWIFTSWNVHTNTVTHPVAGDTLTAPEICSNLVRRETFETLGGWAFAAIIEQVETSFALIGVKIKSVLTGRAECTSRYIDGT